MIAKLRLFDTLGIYIKNAVYEKCFGVTPLQDNVIIRLYLFPNLALKC